MYIFVNGIYLLVFGPVFFRPLVFDVSYITNVPKQSCTVEFLLEHASELFDLDEDKKTKDEVSKNQEKSLKQSFPKPKAILQLSGEWDSSDEEIDDDNYNMVQVSKIPSYLQEDESEEETFSDLPHNWEKQKSTSISWCACCSKIIAPKSKKKPVKFKVCTACDKPIHSKCASSMIGCKPTKKEQIPSTICVGAIAPDIPNVKRLPDGTSLSLYDLLDEGKKIVLFFYPKCKYIQNCIIIIIDSNIFYLLAFTPLCTIQNKCFRNNFEYFHYANCEVIGVSPDTSECQKRFAKEYSLPYHFISDNKGTVRRNYQVPSSMGGLMPGRATYIIAPHSHKIVKIHHSNMTAKDHVFTSLQIVSELIQLESQLGSMSLVDFDSVESSLASN